MSMSVTKGDSTLPAAGNSAVDPTLSANFKAAVAGGSPSGLAVSGNQIDTGRYVITGSNSYTRPTDGGHADDGMVQIFDKTNQSFVDVYGDPHVYTSSGDCANFQADGLTINLADGTQVQFKPTVETKGVSHLDAIAVTKDNQTVVQSGYYSEKGGAHVSTASVTQGLPTAAQGFNDTRDTVLSVGYAGSLGTLVNTMGMQLNSKTYEDSLDGMGGGFAAFGDNSGIQAMQAYGKALADNASSSGSTVPAAARSTVGAGADAQAAVTGGVPAPYDPAQA